MDVFIGRSKHPFVHVKLPSHSGPVALTCLIDTGFAGGIAIPEILRPRFDFPLITKQQWRLADGTDKVLNVYSGKILVGQEEIAIETIFVNGDEGLIGIEFLLDKRLVLEIKKNLVSLE